MSKDTITVNMNVHDIPILVETLEKSNKEIEELKEQLNNEIEEELKQSEIMVKKQEEIERLKDLIKALFYRDYKHELSEEQLELLDNIVFGSIDKEKQCTNCGQENEQ